MLRVELVQPAHCRPEYFRRRREFTTIHAPLDGIWLRSAKFIRFSPLRALSVRTLDFGVVDVVTLEPIHKFASIIMA